ncbi:DUF4230 domain-containing protein [Prevotella communis]|uniref:DUF4230 domain-containing protein n=1 Tax=Prevotella communis TaxID=2913614 RepID=UPI001EDA02E8|nr:DUF4230 domain-containing protein [Prevotella communis]UKK58791.1 DUF4230 domain-containing protein [Prevotella communis]UKK61560.1 DUF4230 domain-containing protein [Prevotella communis]UKK64386.1 DUF4230 domain-containing protein [Prevotella communis]
MEQHNKKLLFTCGGIAAIVLVFVLTLGLIGLFFFDKLSDRLPGLHSEDTSEMIMTPSEIESIRRIGQWEFMAINDEELVDTVRKGFFSDDHLVRIYYGTIRLGLDLSDFDASRISMHEDSLAVQLPQITLLDNHFIDEARTQSFHESGSWSNKDRQALYERARHKMKTRCITPATCEGTRQLAESQVRRLLMAMGYEKVSISFDEPQQQ